MLDLILEFANEDERVRAVMMNGSRVNPTVSRDIFQDWLQKGNVIGIIKSQK